MKKIITVLFMLLASISHGADIKSELFVFIGKKISVNQFEPESEDGSIIMDESFIAKYRVLENIYGDLKSTTIEFEVYDHYGIPPFTNNQTVLLYVVKTGGKYYHLKYQYSALYKTKENKWAGTYSDDYFHPYNAKTTIRPVKIEFEPPVKIDLSEYSEDQIKKWFPEPFFEIRNKKAIALYGNYIDDLFQLKKDGVLKAREYFK